MVFVDLHAHTSKISHCCRAESIEILKTAQEYGFDGIVITNHYTQDYFNERNHREWIEEYIHEWNQCRQQGKSLGVKVFCGIEVTWELNPKVHLLVYGADEAFLREHLFLCHRTLEEIYDLCHAHGCALVQAHPFRNGGTIADTRYLDGLEINCHPTYKNSYAAEIRKTAEVQQLALTVGCDYHADNYRAKGGMFLPEEIETDQDLADYILRSDTLQLQIHEPADGTIQCYEYQRI